MLVSAWDALSRQTIVNCFRKSGISTESQEADIAEDDDPFRELQDETDDLRSFQPNFIEEINVLNSEQDGLFRLIRTFVQKCLSLACSN